MHRLVALALGLLLPALAGAADVPISGRKLSLRASQTQPGRRSAKVVVNDPALAAPLPDPRLGAVLVVNGGAGAGQCRATIVLEPGQWEALASGGYRYRVDAPGTQGVRKIVLRPGTLTVTARGSAWPCDLAAATERVPVSVELRVEDVRYCASFGGNVARNGTGRFTARNALAPAACGDTDVTVADLNHLHGLFCPGGDYCRLSDRIDLLFQWIVAAGCPDIVTLQEVTGLSDAVPLITAQLATACPFPYLLIYQKQQGFDDEMILSRYPAASFEYHYLYKNFRHVLYARIDHPAGALDLFTTHLASSSDGAGNPCGADCPAECLAASVATRRQCQGVQVGDFVTAKHDGTLPALVTGDFNESPTDFVYTHLVGLGWTDTYLAAGNPECDADTGVGCTSGRADEDLSELESPASNESERIDYIFFVPAPGSLCAGTIDDGTDADGDGTATKIFADDPNPFAPTCGPLPDAICWPSDHEGAQVDVNCD